MVAKTLPFIQYSAKYLYKGNGFYAKNDHICKLNDFNPHFGHDEIS